MKSSESARLPFKRAHFIGIGGIGMSGLARLLLNLGCRVTGSDLQPTEITRELARSGARIFPGHKASHIDGAQAVVVSSAVGASNPEIVRARRLGLPVLKRAEMLAELARLKKTVTVAGCHGKTTTTSMAALALAKAGADPTMVIGGQLKNIASNARLGLGEYLVAEADESDGSFLLLSPLVAIVTNVDNDHLDYYKSMANIRSAFLRHVRNLPAGGAAVLCADDPELAQLIPKIQNLLMPPLPLAGEGKGEGALLGTVPHPTPLPRGERAIGEVLPKIKRTVITYGLDKQADWQARRLDLSASGSKFTVCHRGRPVARAALRVPGRHNILNALAAVAAGRFLGFDLKKLLAGLEEFTGVGRRLDRLGDAGGVAFLDDYGHHPTEIRATVAAVKELYCRRSKAYPHGRRLAVVFQPHRFSRTKLLKNEFGPAFKAADVVYVAEIYGAGERPIPGVSSRFVLHSLRRSRVPCAPLPRVVDLAREIRAGDVLLTLGAGDVWKIGEDLRRRFASKNLAVC